MSVTSQKKRPVLGSNVAPAGRFSALNVCSVADWFKLVTGDMVVLKGLPTSILKVVRPVMITTPSATKPLERQ